MYQERNSNALKKWKNPNAEQTILLFYTIALLPSTTTPPPPPRFLKVSRASPVTAQRHQHQISSLRVFFCLCFIFLPNSCTLVKETDRVSLFFQLCFSTWVSGCAPMVHFSFVAFLLSFFLFIPLTLFFFSLFGLLLPPPPPPLLV